MHSTLVGACWRGACLALLWWAGASQAAGFHTPASYRALEVMPEVADVGRVTVESLDNFLRFQEKTLEALLASQEAWAVATLEFYPQSPPDLAFVARPQRSEEARRAAFLRALRISPNTKFALFYEPDPNGPSATNPTGASLNAAQVGSVTAGGSLAGPEKKFLALRPGDQISPLAVVASASDEPGYGMDAYLWDNSPNKRALPYGFGFQPFGDPGSAIDAQAPFQMGFFHEDAVLYSVAPWARRSMVQARYYQFSTLASLALRTGHDYWGWRFAGLALYYLQNLTHPYFSRLAPGESSLTLLGYHTLARLGMPALRKDRIRSITNQRVALTGVQAVLVGSSKAALQAQDQDASYPEWSNTYLRDVVSAQSAQLADAAHQVLLDNLPSEWLIRSTVDLQLQDDNMRLLPEMLKQDEGRRARFQVLNNEIMRNFGAHSRNALRAIVRSGNRF
jgi:hypothetical protein